MRRVEGNLEAVDPLTKRPPTLEQKTISTAPVEHGSEVVKDYLFDQYMKQQLLEDFFEGLEDYFDPSTVDKMRETATEFTDEEIYTALALPYELREKMFMRFKSEMEQGLDSGEVMRQFIQRSKKYDFGIGYHTSPADIRPDESKGDQWVILGTEADHRDDDRLMAYYSTKYRHLFKRNNPRFIYLIRTDPSVHKTDGNWSRADSLSVVIRVPFLEVVEYVEKTAKQIRPAEPSGSRAG